MTAWLTLNAKPVYHYHRVVHLEADILVWKSTALRVGEWSKTNNKQINVKGKLPGDRGSDRIDP